MSASADRSASPLAAATIIVPVGPGDEAWRDLLVNLRNVDVAAEILIVATEPAPESALPTRNGGDRGPRWVESAGGRANQLNRGAALASGEFLWFLHADSRVSPDAIAALERALLRDPDALYYFDLRFRNDGPWLTRFNAVGANLRSRWLGLPFGDQGFCLSRQTWALLGGFDASVPCGEDHLLVWAARRQQIAVRSVRASIGTSARKYAEQGWLATTAHHGWQTLRQAAGELARPWRRPNP